MSEPSYHLEAVVKSRDQREDFTGPLDLILLLLSKNKIEIRDIQISSLLDQYLAWLARMKEMDLDVASEFVQMASHLTYIKTRMLLTSDNEEVGELTVLVEALEKLQNRDVLQALKAVAPELDRRTREGFRLHTRPPSPLPGTRWEYREDPIRLLQAMAGMMLRGGEQREDSNLMRAIPRPVVYGIREKSEELVGLLREKKTLPLTGLYALCRSRSELVATFISVLDLCGDGLLRVEQEGDGYLVRCMMEEEDE